MLHLQNVDSEPHRRKWERPGRRRRESLARDGIHVEPSVSQVSGYVIVGMGYNFEYI